LSPTPPDDFVQDYALTREEVEDPAKAKGKAKGE